MNSHVTAVTPEERALVLDVLKRYALTSAPVDLYRHTAGFVNKTFVVDLTDGEKVVLRQSKPSADLEHLELEVEVLRYLESKNCSFSPRLIANAKGQYFIIYRDSFYTLQRFIPGEIKASWNNVESLTGERLASFFKLSARFTRIVEDFKPLKTYRNVPLAQYTCNARTLFTTALEKIPKSAGRDLLLSRESELLSFGEQANRELESLHYNELPKQVVHFDVHPGNVHFTGNEAVGLFDLDWLQFDSRITDFAGTIGQSCYVYGGERSGVYIKEKVQEGIAAYRAEYGVSEFSLTEENKLLTSALKAYMFFQLLWSMDWYRENNADTESLTVLRHFINACILNDYGTLIV